MLKVGDVVKFKSTLFNTESTYKITWISSYGALIKIDYREAVLSSDMFDKVFAEEYLLSEDTKDEEIPILKGILYDEF